MITDRERPTDSSGQKMLKVTDIVLERCGIVGSTASWSQRSGFVLAAPP
jgi:hypothetical protein